MWLCDTEMGIEKREVTYVPGLYKIVDEILMFVADNKVTEYKQSDFKIEDFTKQNDEMFKSIE